EGSYIQDAYDDTITTDHTNQQTTYENHLKQVLQVRREIVRNDENYRNKMLVCASVHRRKPAFNPGDKVAIAPDHDNNQKTRKRKLEQACSITGEVIGMCSNNRTVRIEVDGQVKTFAAKNVKKLSN
ncbi:8396_t:CDS:1, partial [Paraglomus occultum]